MAVKYDWINGDKIYISIKSFLYNNGYKDADGYWLPCQENAYEIGIDGTIECNEGFVNIYASYNDKYDFIGKPFSVEIHEFTNPDIIDGIKNIVSKYPNWYVDVIN